MSYKIAFVIPRFEVGKAGGAEIHAAQLATRLAQRGHHVEVFTTCAEDHHRWGNVRKAGSEVSDRITVHRYLTDLREDIWLFHHLQKKMHLGLPLTVKEEEGWLSNSVHSRSLYDELQKRAGDFDGIIFMPYLFGITYEGSKRVPDKFILIPCLHDEPFARLAVTKDLFLRSRSIFFNTQPELELAQRLYALNGHKKSLVALGFDEISSADPKEFRRKYAIGDDPYFLFVGRWEKGKNVHLLIEYFKKYFINQKRNAKFILLGSGDVEIPKAFEDCILPLGFVPQEDKLAAVAGATALCQPSVNESLSIVIMEAWSLKTPVLVHGNCAVTKYHCVQSGGGLYFSDYLQFEEAVNFFLDQESLGGRMGELGYRYVRKNYSWDKVLNRFETAFKDYLSDRQ